jgi:NAD(P)-dependent dehydrogenase (short-subunit alcohol dehydrogenase family)
MDRVKGKVVIITGAARGLGKAQALLLAEEGAKVAATDIDEVRGMGVVEEVERKGGEALFVKHDVSQEESWKEVMEKTLSAYGGLDVLVNNAGVFFNKPVEEISLEEWRQLMSVNLEGVFLGTKQAILRMKKTGGGSIINISSTAGLVGMPDSSAYVASKGAVRLFTKATALECSKAVHDHNIRVNSIHPGLIRTEMFEEILKDEAEKTGVKQEDVEKLFRDMTMVGHFGSPVDVAYGVLYLASDESRYITGAELVIDGGVTAR